jgi:hypothetical protein
MNKKMIIDAYCKIRTIDNTIPDDVLDFMKEAALEKLKAIELETKILLPMKKDINCKHCGEPHDKKTVERVYGKDSMVALGGFCSAECYTKNFKRKTFVPSVLNWNKAAFVPDMRLSSGDCSDLVLVFCKDGEIRTGRYHKIGKIHSWSVTGVCGQPEDYVVYWAVNITSEKEKLNARMKEEQTEAWLEQGSRHTDS